MFSISQKRMLTHIIIVYLTCWRTSRLFSKAVAFWWHLGQWCVRFWHLSILVTLADACHLVRGERVPSHCSALHFPEYFMNEIVGHLYTFEETFKHNCFKYRVSVKVYTFYSALWRKDDLYDFQARLVYIRSSRPVKAMKRNLVSTKQQSPNNQ